MRYLVLFATLLLASCGSSGVSEEPSVLDYGLSRSEARVAGSWRLDGCWDVVGGALVEVAPSGLGVLSLAPGSPRDGVMEIGPWHVEGEWSCSHDWLHIGTESMRYVVEMDGRLWVYWDVGASEDRRAAWVR